MNNLLFLIGGLLLVSCVTDGSAPQGATATSATEEAANLEVPTLETLPNGDLRVTFPMKGCVVLFNSAGTLIEGGRACDDVDLHRAREAVRAHFAEQSSDFSDV